MSGERVFLNKDIGERPYASLLLDDMTEKEVAIARKVESVVPILRSRAEKADKDGQFQVENIEDMRKAGLMGLVVPEEYGGLGGSLRDLAGACFTLASADASTALAYFFHCSSSSRGLLALEAVENGLFEAAEHDKVKAFAERILYTMGRDGQWLANFASESVKTSQSALTIATEATPVDGGFEISGVKSFGSGTGIANKYLVTAKLAGTTTAEGLGVFIVDPKAKGVANRHKWDPIGMRSTETHGITLDKVFVSDDDALAIPGSFVKMMQMSRGSFVGNQVCVAASYLGIAQGVYDYTLEKLLTNKFADTGRPLAESPFHQDLIGKMTVDIEMALMWTRRQIYLETVEPPVLPKQRVVAQWRMCKGEVCEAAYRVAVNALKASGTSATSNNGPISRGIRDLCMGLVQAFPAERGRLEAAKMITTHHETAFFGVTDKK